MKRTSRLYRLSQREEKATVKKIVYLFVVSLLLLIFIFTLGISLLGKFADFLDVVFKKNASSQTSMNITVPQAPVLDSLPSATNSARLSVSGFSATEGKINIYDNSEKVSETNATGGEFKSDDLTLKDGDNNISAKAVSPNGKESDFSNVQKVSFLQKEPTLKVDSPADGQSFSGDNRIKVSGKTDQNALVYANGFLANTNTDGLFEVFIPLVSGDNNLEIKAVDLAGNTKIVKIKVTFNK